MFGSTWTEGAPRDIVDGLSPIHITRQATSMSQPYTYLTEDALAIEVCEYLATEDFLALDTETHANGLPAPPALVESGKAFTDPYSNQIRLVQIRSRDSEAFLFDLTALGNDGRKAVIDLLNQPHITWLGHNLKFDYKMIAANLGAYLKKVYDTQIAAIAIGFAIGDGILKARGWRLKDLTRDYLGQDLDKTEQTSNWAAKELSESQKQYAADDLLYLFDLHDVLNRAIVTEYGMEDAVKLEMQTLPVVCKMELNGIDFDEKMYLKVQEAAKFYLPELERQICGFINWPMIATPPLEYFKTKRKWKPKPSKFDGDGEKSPLDSNPFMLKALRQQGIPVENLRGEELEPKFDTYPILRVYAQYKDLQKALSFNYLEWVHPVTGKIHPEFNQMGAATGRFTCYNPNLQQVSKMDVEVAPQLVDDWLKAFTDADGNQLYFVDPDGTPLKLGDPNGKWKLNYRYCFVAPEGWTMAGADFSGQEVSVMVCLSGDKSLIKTLNEPKYVLDPFGSGVMVKNMGADIHARTAELMFGPEYGITAWDAKKKTHPKLKKKFRDIAKVIVFGLAYGKSAAGLAEDWGITQEEAQEIIDKFFENYQTLKKWLERKGTEADKTRMSIYGLEGTSMIRLRMVNSGRHSDAGALKRAGMNTPIQGASALMMKQTLVFLDELLEGTEARICGTIHDEVIVRFPGDWKLGKKHPSIKPYIDLIDQGMGKGSNVFLRGIVPDAWGVGASRSWTKD